MARIEFGQRGYFEMWVYHMLAASASAFVISKLLYWESTWYSCISTDQAGEIQDEVKLLEDKNNTGTKYEDDDEDED